jgi:hypothetical protein
LQAEDDSKKDWDFIVQSIEGGLIILVLFVQWPDVRRDKICIVLDLTKLVLKDSHRHAALVRRT